MNRVVVSCMDRRLSSFLDETYNDGRTVFVRNAGANMATVVNTVKQLSIEFPIKKIVIAPHTDCGAMGIVDSAVHANAKASQAIENSLVAQFRKLGFDSRKALEERLNGSVQRDAIASFAKSIGAEVDVSLIDLGRLDLPAHSGKHILTITKPTATSYFELLKRFGEGVGMFDSYFIQAKGMRDVLPDIEVAVSALHISDVRLLSESDSGNSIMDSDLALLKKQEYMKGVEISTIAKE